MLTLSHPWSNRSVRRSFVFLSVLVAFFATLHPTSAAITWCKTDPIVRLNGVTYQVLIGVPQENVKQIDGELFFEVYSPKGTTRELLFVDDGYNGYGEKVVFKTHSSTTTHKFYFDMPHNNAKFPVQMEIFRNGTLIKTVVGTSDTMSVSVPTP